MNERIKELREQAAKFAEITYGNYTMATFDTNKSIETLFEEKFAELLVKECASVCESMQLIGPYKEVQDATLKDASVQIKEHFGVEE
jgi:hypothetical protein